MKRSMFLACSVCLAALAAGAATDVFNVRDFGAKGDGASSDSVAVQKALDAAAACGGTVYFPVGTYRVHDLKVASGVTLTAHPKWIWQKDPGGAVLSLDKPDARCVLDITATYGVRIDGLFIDGGFGGLGHEPVPNARKHYWEWDSKPVHGILLDNRKRREKEDCPVIENVKVQRFSGDGLHMTGIWCFTLRHAQFAFNRGNGVTMHGCDGYILDCQFSGNGGDGFAAYGSTCGFTACRSEQNGRYGLGVYNADSWNVTGCSFDRNGFAAIAFDTVRTSTVTGNLLRRAGGGGGKGPEADHVAVQALLRNCSGVTFTCNTGLVGADDDGKGQTTPDFALLVKDLDCCVVKDNVFWRGYLKDLLLDQGGHVGGTVLRDNLGSCAR